MLKRHSPTPPRGKMTLEGEAASTLQRTQETAQSAAGYVDGAMQEAWKAMLETASVQKAVEDTLSMPVQASTSLSGQQIAQLVCETSAEFQAAIGEQKRLEQRFKEQHEETIRLCNELHEANAAQSANVQALQHSRAIE